MAFTATAQWDVRTTGSNSNGGGFDPTSTGTNFAMQDSPQVTYTDLVVDAVTNTNCTSAGNPFTSVDVGNVINVTSGTGFSVQRVQVISVAAGVATCDKSLGTLSSTGGHGVLGGGLATIATANTLAVIGNTLNIKAGTYTLTASVAVGQITVNWIGYANTWADGGTKPLITTATNATVLINTGSSNGGLQTFHNLSLSNSAATRASGIWQLSAHGTTQAWVFTDCIFDGFTTAVDSSNLVPFDVAFVTMLDCEVKNCTVYGLATSNASGTNATFIRVEGCNFHDNSGHIDTGPNAAGGAVLRNRFWNGTTGSPEPLQFQAGHVIFDQNTMFNNVGSGVSFSSTGTWIFFSNNISYGNAAYGVITVSSTLTIQQAVAAGRNNAYGGNGIANYNGLAACAGDIILSADPFTNSAIGDFSLNTVAGGGALLRGAAYNDPNLDIGAIQSPSSSPPSSGSANYGITS